MKKILIISLIAIMSFSTAAFAHKVNFYEDDMSMYNEVFISDGVHTRYYVDGNYVVGLYNIINRSGTSKTYYFDENGFKTSGWKYVNNNWYRFDSTGVMQTGWYNDVNGKWYYLNTDGTMAHDCYIGSYKLGPDGTWIS